MKLILFASIMLVVTLVYMLGTQYTYLKSEISADKYKELSIIQFQIDTEKENNNRLSKLLKYSMEDDFVDNNEFINISNEFNRIKKESNKRLFLNSIKDKEGFLEINPEIIKH